MNLQQLQLKVQHEHEQSELAHQQSLASLQLALILPCGHAYDHDVCVRDDELNGFSPKQIESVPQLLKE
jgi:hypothetical protein